MKSCLEADSLLKSYGHKVILSDVYLRCETGELVALWGRNGSGKSTLFEIVFGTVRAENAFVRINEKVVTGKAYRTGQIAFLPQYHFLPPDLKVRQVLRLAGMSHVTSLFQGEGMPVESERLKNLSGGTLRLLEILYVTTRPAPFLLLDEPFSGLSPVLVEAVSHYLQDLSKEKGLVVADHNHCALCAIATRHLLLADGCLRSLAAPELLKGDYLP